AGDADAKVLALEQLHDDVGDAVRGHSVIEDLHGVRAPDASRGHGLAAEARQEPGVADERFADELDRHLGVEREVLRAPDAAHTPSGQRFDQAQVGAHEGAWMNAHGGTLPRRNPREACVLHQPYGPRLASMEKDRPRKGRSYEAPLRSYLLVLAE